MKISSECEVEVEIKSNLEGKAAFTTPIGELKYDTKRSQTSTVACQTTLLQISAVKGLEQ